MASEWLNAKELEPIFKAANERLEGQLGRPLKRVEALPETVQGINKRARSESWVGRPRPGVRGMEYSVFDLPPKACKAVLDYWKGQRPKAKEKYEPSALEAGGRAFASMTETERLRADSMLEILTAHDVWRMENPGVPKFGGYEAFSVLYNIGKIDVPDWVYEARPRISKNTLHKHDQLRKQGVFHAMGGRYGNRKGTGVFDRCPALRKLVIGVINQRPNAGPKKVRTIALTEMGKTVTVSKASGGEEQVDMPSVKSFERFMVKWKEDNMAAHVAVTDPDRYRNAFRYAAGKMYADIVRRNQLWEIDASPADALCLDGRWSLYILVDVHSRWPKARVTKTPKTVAALLLVRDCILAWGFPEVLKTDNGSDFTSQHFKDAIRRLGMFQDISPPYTPEDKACVERTIGTIQRNFMEYQPGYVGHDVAERKAIEARKSFAQRLGQSDADAFCVELTGAELEKRLNDWIENVYVHEPHEGLGGKTPFEVRTAYQGAIRRLTGDNEGALEHLLMAPADGATRVVTKKGIKVNKIDYYLPDGLIMPGETVHVRLDPDDIGKVYVYRGDPWEFVGIAINPEREGISRKEVAAKVKESQKKAVAEMTKEIRSAMRSVDLAAVSLKMTQQGADRTESLIAFPERTAEHMTPDLQAAAQAAGFGRDFTPAPRTEADQKAEAAIVEDLAAKREERKPVTDEEKYDRWLTLDARLQAGAGLSVEDAKFHRLFRQSPAWRRVREHREMIEEFNRSLTAG